MRGANRYPQPLQDSVFKITQHHSQIRAAAWLLIIAFTFVFRQLTQAESNDTHLNVKGVLTPITVEYQIGANSIFSKYGFRPLVNGTYLDANCLPRVTLYHEWELDLHLDIDSAGEMDFEHGTLDSTSRVIRTNHTDILTNCSGSGDFESSYGWFAEATRNSEGIWTIDLVGCRSTNAGNNTWPRTPTNWDPCTWDFGLGLLPFDPSFVTTNCVLPWPWDDAILQTKVSYHDEFTTAELLKQAAGGNVWSDTDAWTTGIPSVSLGLTPDETVCTNQVARYRFKFIAEAGQPYSFDYLVRFIPDDTNLTQQVEKHTVSGVGTGAVQYWPAAGGANALLYGKDYLHTNNAAGCSFIVGGTSTLKLPGCAGGCTSCFAAGDFSPAIDSVRIQTSLGSDSRGENSGQLVIFASSPSAALFTPSAINYFGDLANAELIYDGSVLRQVKTAQVLADITSLSSSSYQIAFYTGTFSKSGGLYSIGTHTPYTTGTIQQQNSSINQLQLTVQSQTGDPRTYLYTWSNADQGWTLNSAGIRKETKKWSLDGLTETDTIRDASDKIIYQEVNTYYIEPTSHAKFLTQKVLGANGENVTTHYTYYDDSVNDPVNFGRIKTEIEPSGRWTRYEYDTTGILIKQVHQFLNGATTAADNLCRVFEHDYTRLGGAIYSERTVEKLLGVEIGRTYFLRFADQEWCVQCQTPGAAWNAADNLTTITRYATVDGENLPAQIAYPDGTMQLCTYQTGAWRTNCVSLGQPNAVKTVITSGNQTVEVVDDRGLVLWSVTTNIDSMIMTAASTNRYDDYGRLTDTYYLGGTHTHLDYNCCGVSTETDIAGTVTSYDYDALKRRTTTTRNGISTIQNLDALGHALSTVRQGADTSQIMISSSGFDTAGRAIASTNALGNPTSYTYGFDANGQTVNTTAFPDTGTRIETYAQDGSLISVTGTAVHPFKNDYGVVAESGVNRVYAKQTKLETTGAATQEWQTTFSDMLARPYKTLRANGATTLSYYNDRGQLVACTDEDSVTTLYQYNGRGELEYTAIDVNNNGQIDFTGSDRITRTVNDVVNDFGIAVLRTRIFNWNRCGSDSSTISISEQSVDGTSQWDISPKGTNHSQTVLNGNGLRNVTETAPDGSSKVYTYTADRLQSLSARDSLGQQISGTTYGYDSHGRLNTTTDARNGTTTYQFNDSDQPIFVYKPSTDGAQPPMVTTNFYDGVGRLSKREDPGGAAVTNEYYFSGDLKRTYGRHQYPIEKSYDSQARTKTLTTWKNFGANNGKALTRWSYDTASGFLQNKIYDGNVGAVTYDYTTGGKLKNRTWARSINTSYTYNGAGDIAAITHDDSTPNISFGYDRHGLQQSITNGNVVTTRQYNEAGLLTSERYIGGPLDGVAITNYYDQFQRRTNLTVLTQPAIVSVFTYDNASRLSTVSDGVNSATYSYSPNSSLVDHVSFARNGATSMATQNTFDHLDRLVNVRSTANGVAVSSFTYGYNPTGERSAVTNLDGTYWLYTYDNVGQLTTGKKYWSDGTPVAGQQFEYGFDDIGNRTNTRTGGNETGSKLRAASYLNNNLNQIVSRAVPGAIDVLGSASSTATVTINNQRGYRRGDYFRNEVPIPNSTSAVYGTVTTLAVLNNTSTSDTVSTNVGHVFVPKTPERFQYDADGNLISDGRFNYTWDGENRLIRVQSHDGAPANSKIQVDCVYDFLGRRIQKTVSTWNGSSYVLSTLRKFVYDGWNLIAELDSTNHVVCCYMWGLDISQSVGGAGGIGGAISMTDYRNALSVTHFYTYDGNGNVSGLVRGDNSAMTANYEYGPFGETIRATEAVESLNAIRFSTKYQDGETGFLNYGRRYYHPTLGKWLSRDPVEENGGRNLYASCQNDMLSLIDYLGEEIEWHHIFPQTVWSEFEQILKQAGFTKEMLHSKEWGWILDKEEHSLLHNKVLAEDLNYVEHWRKWMRTMTANGRTVTLKQIRAHAQKIVTQSVWKDTFKVGVRSKWAYGPAWTAAKKKVGAQIERKITRLMAKRAARVGAEGATSEAPPIELGVDAFFFVCDAFDKDVTWTEAVVGNLPYVGLPYSIAKMTSKDTAIRKETTERFYTDGDRTAPDFGESPDDWVDTPAPPNPN